MTDRSWLYEDPEPGMHPTAIAAQEGRDERRRAALHDPPPPDPRDDYEPSHECIDAGRGRCRICGDQLTPLPGGD